MSNILTCVDGSVYAESVVDHAAWAARRLDLPIELLQVLGRREADSSDRSGRIVAGARRKLLEELAALDAARAKLLIEDAWLRLDQYKTQLVESGVSDVSVAVRHGDLLETIDEREKDASFVVIGKRGEAADFATLHLGSNLERLVRAATRPMLISSRAFRPITRVMIAFDGGSSALKAVDEASRSPLFAGLEIVLLMVAEPSDTASAALSRAADQLHAAGLGVETMLEDGRPEAVIGNAVERTNIDLLMMGAYGHSRLRTLVIGSTTSALIRVCQVPIAVYR